MKLYRTRTQEEYDWLMQKLENEGYMWVNGGKPTQDPDAKEYANEIVIIPSRNKYLMWNFVKDLESKDLNKIIEVSELMKEQDPLAKKVEERNNKPEKEERFTIQDRLGPQLEKLLPHTKADRHEQLLKHLNETYRKKNKDYGDAFGKSHEKYGAIAGLTRINDKFNRLEEIILSGEQLVEDETVLDTLLDMANYAVMLYMELEESNERD